MKRDSLLLARMSTQDVMRKDENSSIHNKGEASDGSRLKKATKRRELPSTQQVIAVCEREVSKLPKGVASDGRGMGEALCFRLSHFSRKRNTETPKDPKGPFRRSGRKRENGQKGRK